MRTFQQGTCPAVKYEQGRLIWKFNTEASGFACGWANVKPTIQVDDNDLELAEQLLAAGAVEVI